MVPSICSKPRVLSHQIFHCAFEREESNTYGGKGGGSDHSWEGDGVRSPLLKMWDLEKVDKKMSMETPVLFISVKVQTGNRPQWLQVSSIALSDNLSHLAIWFADGTILLYRYPFSCHRPYSYTQLRSIHESPTEPITSFRLRGGIQPEHCGRSWCRFWICDYALAQRNIIIAREKAVYVCGVVERGTCYAYEGAYFPVLFVSYRTIPDVGSVFLSFSHR
jgi:hypothetical protein